MLIRALESEWLATTVTQYTPHSNGDVVVGGSDRLSVIGSVGEGGALGIRGGMTSAMSLPLPPPSGGGMSQHDAIRNQHDVALVPLFDLVTTGGVVTRFVGESVFDYKVRLQQVPTCARSYTNLVTNASPMHAQHLWCARVYEQRQQEVVQEINTRIKAASDKYRNLSIRCVCH